MVFITVFTGNDINSQAVVKALQKRNLDFSIISVVDHPWKLDDLKDLTGGSVAVPRVFFDCRHVGGVDQVMRELRRIDLDPKYRAFILSNNNHIRSAERRLSASSASTASSSSSTASGCHVHDKSQLPPLSKPEVAPQPSTRIPATTIELPDGTSTTFWDMTEKLKNSLPKSDVNIRGGFYRRVFTGSQALLTFQSSMKLSSGDAEAFANRLLQERLFHRVATMGGKKHKFEGSDRAYYRLQCYMTPDILNSYKIWTVSKEYQERQISPFDIVKNLDARLKDIEDYAVDYNGMLDCRRALSYDNFPEFEEAVCELQVVDIHQLSSSQERLAFGLNVYKLFLRYACLKIGIPIHEADRIHFLRRLKFNIGGLLYSFQEYLDGVLRGNNKSVFTQSPLSRTDPRAQLTVMTELDNRIHFALNSGATVGCLTSLPFREYNVDGIFDQLEMAGNVFWEDHRNFSTNLKTKEILFAKVMGWYRCDFPKKDADLVQQIKKYLSGHQISRLPSEEELKIGYLDTNWARSSVNFTRYDKDTVVADLKGLKLIKKRFQSPKIPENEAVRMSVVRSLNVLDTLPEERYDRITRMVQHHFGVPIAFISVIDTDRQWFKSTQSTLVEQLGPETSRESSFCGHAILEEDMLCLNDVVLDDRFADNPHVVGGIKIRFYVGCPLKIPDQKDPSVVVNIGTLCAVDERPREFSDADKVAMRSFAKKVEACLMSRRQDHPLTFLQDCRGNKQCQVNRPLQQDRKHDLARC